MNEQTRVARAAHAVPFTADDFLRMMELGAFRDMRAELAGGEIEKMMPANLTHAELNMTLGVLLHPYAREAGLRLTSDLAVRIDDTTVRGIDVALVRSEAPGSGLVPGDQVVHAIEIADTTLSRDLGEKREEYSAAGIPAYWVVDCDHRVVHVFRLAEGAMTYDDATIVPFGQPLDLPGMDGSITID